MTASELGPEKFNWWLDWRGECVAIIASGASAAKADIAALRDRIHVIAIKKNFELCSWADVVYGCDGPWWRSVNGLPEYKGLKLSYAKEVCFPDVHKVNIPGLMDDRILTDEPAVIGSGGNSGFQAINIAVQFGATGIILIGFDMHDRNGAHWYGRNNWASANNPRDTNFVRWLAAFNAVAPGLKSLGIEVVNASPESALQCFRRGGIQETLARWGL